MFVLFGKDPKYLTNSSGKALPMLSQSATSSQIEEEKDEKWSKNEKKKIIGE